MPQFSPLPASKFQPACRRDNGHKKRLAPTVLTRALLTPRHLPSAPLRVPLEQMGYGCGLYMIHDAATGKPN